MRDAVGLDTRMVSDVLGWLRRMWERTDPADPELVLRVCFAMQLDDSSHDAPVVHLLSQATDVAVGARGAGPEPVRTMSFAGPELTVMVTFTSAGDDTFRVDGWLVPAFDGQIVARIGIGEPLEHTTTADQEGRFVLRGLPGGPTRLEVHRYGSAQCRMLTPRFVLE